ncbi:hypothetical protein ACSBL2_22940 [Pedobacter sp. AW31-3R]|uniref:hypothetical protein n=1 Tax=Pedobacter sp. AW31-3R TaxID=3445781 RepID=UPI003FA1654C
MSLSDSFPEHLRQEFAQRNLKIGSVIRVYVQDTIPPKEKRFILVGQSYDKLIFATIFINSEINPNIFPQQELRDLNIELTTKDRAYLDHDSYADCSNIKKRNASWLLDIISIDPARVIGEVSEDDLKTIREKIKSARTISPALKKTFGLYF